MPFGGHRLVERQDIDDIQVAATTLTTTLREDPSQTLTHPLSSKVEEERKAAEEASDTIFQTPQDKVLKPFTVDGYRETVHKDASGLFSVEIFVASRYQSMHAEREYLRRMVEPELNRRCVAHGVRLRFVDLHWGKQFEDHNELLLKALAMVQRASPWLIVLNDSSTGYTLGTQAGEDEGLYPIPR